MPTTAQADSTSKTRSNHQAEFESAKLAAKEAYENFVEARRHLKSAARAAGVELKDNASERLDDAISMLWDEKEKLLHTSEDYIRENPVTSAGIAFLAGFLVSKILGK